MANFSPWRYQTWVGFPSLHKSDAHYELFASRIVVLEFAALPVAGGPSLIFIRTPQPKGHPYPVLSRSTPKFFSLLTEKLRPTELAARPSLALATICGIAMATASDSISNT